MVTTVFQLSRVDSLSPGDVLPAYISADGDTRSIEYGKLQTQLETSIGATFAAEIAEAQSLVNQATEVLDLSVVENQDVIDAAETASDAAAMAQTHALAAATSAATAVANAANYASTAAALADGALTVGSQFTVASGDLVLMYRKDSGPVATFLYSVANGDFSQSARRTMGLSSLTTYAAFTAGSITPSASRSYTPAAATQYDIVAVVRGNNCDWVQLLCSSGSLQHDCLFRLSTQTIGRQTTTIVPPVQTPTMRYLGGDRWELKVRVLSTGTSASVLQLRPTLDGNFPMTGDTGRGLFVETFEVRLAGSGTNLWSTGDIADAAFTKVGLTISSVATTERSMPSEFGDIEDYAESLDALMTGRMSGVRLTEAAGAGLSVRLFHSFFTAPGDVVTVTVRAKKGERFRLNLFANNSVSIDATFDLETRTGSGSGATVTHLGGDWCECTATATAGLGGSTNIQVRVYPTTGGHPYTGDGTSGLFIEDFRLWVNGVKIIESRAEDFARAVWTKQSVTLTQGAARYIGIKQAVVDASEPPYEDGSTALVGLKTAVIGDSISAQLQYTTPLAEQTGIVLTNLSAGGACLASGSSGGSLAIYNQIASIPTDSELVIVQAGVNDFGTDNSDLGSLGDSTTATFYGAIHASVVAIRARAPSAAIVFLTPYSGAAAHATHKHFRTNSRGHTLAQFINAVKVGAGFAGYPVINVGEDAGIGYHTPALFSDNLHINATGGLKYAKFVAQKMRDLALDGVIV